MSNEKSESKKKVVNKPQKVEDLKSLVDENIDVAEDSDKEAIAVRIGKVKCDNLRLRTEPNTDSEVIRYLQPGDVVEILEDANANFYKIDGGFVMKKFIDIDEK